MSRRYVTGLSMGAFGAWALACAEPETFAAIAAICGGLSPPMPRGTALSRILRLAKEPPLEEEVRKVRHIPAWLFHGDRDKIVSLSGSREVYEALGGRKRGETLKLTIYEDVGHHCWHQAYREPDLYDWLLRQRCPSGSHDVGIASSCRVPSSSYASLPKVISHRVMPPQRSRSTSPSLDDAESIDHTEVIEGGRTDSDTDDMTVPPCGVAGDPATGGGSSSSRWEDDEDWRSLLELQASRSAGHRNLGMQVDGCAVSIRDRPPTPMPDESKESSDEDEMEVCCEDDDLSDSKPVAHLTDEAMRHRMANDARSMRSMVRDSHPAAQLAAGRHRGQCLGLAAFAEQVSRSEGSSSGFGKPAGCSSSPIPMEVPVIPSGRAGALRNSASAPAVPSHPRGSDANWEAPVLPSKATAAAWQDEDDCKIVSGPDAVVSRKRRKDGKELVDVRNVGNGLGKKTKA
eukprot:gnl/TRDRNA2_/TRDRNA2_61256_c0_seq1.p1 gnl/TRDRNA2_/TRDRNA2_61256_c0~~gnl/TRDRNA2_/TRDRNA2_61256_c0_seq1.p1  ORF type:complete len:459 (+),score=64.54 gnl/TRDRNA2_/TRDRNA2_61256_c0_seq1:3-1379(+)